VPKLDLVPGGTPPALAEQFEVGYVDDDGQQRLPLTEAWSVPLRRPVPPRHCV
jgi:hypothetical protein